MDDLPSPCAFTWEDFVVDYRPLVLFVVGLFDGQGNAPIDRDVVSGFSRPGPNLVESLSAAPSLSDLVRALDDPRCTDEWLESLLQFLHVGCTQLHRVAGPINSEGDAAPVLGAGDRSAVDVVVQDFDEFPSHVASLF